MAGVNMMVIVMVLVTVSLGGKWVGAQEHHVVGGDRGWDLSSEIADWSSGRLFRVGDKLWFTYSAAHGSVVELKTKEEYEACNVSNPIRMYTDGIDNVLLDGEGIRYFASSKPESCRDGLKLHVEVQPQFKPENQTVATTERSTVAVAAGPTTPSASTHISAASAVMMIGFALCIYLGIY